MKAGRKPKYEKAEDFERVAESYFAACDKDNPPTMAGLSLALGFSTRKSLLDYSEKPEFVTVIKKARTRLEEAVEKRLFGPNATGAIFWLKNHSGYVDRQEREISGKLTLEDLVAGSDTDG